MGDVVRADVLYDSTGTTDDQTYTMKATRRSFVARSSLRAADKQLVLEAQEKEARIGLLIQLKEQRRVYAKAVFNLMCCWMIFVAAVITASGLEWLKLTDAVLTTLVAGTTAKVLGLFGIVMWSLFPRSNQP